MATATKVKEFQLTTAQFDEVRHLVKSMAGISLGEGKRDLVRSRLNKRLRSLEMASYDDYLAMVKADKSGKELVHLLDAISTNVTNFFREPAHFDFLRELLAEREAMASAGRAPRRLRIWSAGCSSGEEPYTIGMTVCESLSTLSGWDIRILATDISTNVLEKASRAVYPKEAAAKMPKGIAPKYFDKTADGQIQVRKPVRDLVTFGRLNMMGSWPMKGPFDAIFCRNVMIYFEKATQIELVKRYHGMLAPGGILFIGHSENLTGFTHGFKSVRPTVYRKVG
jgi:chemotaxis protein methyltransferase CheR